MAAIPFNTLIDEAKCYECFGPLSTAEILELALLRRQAIALAPTAAVTGQELITATECYACLGASMFQLMKLGLLSIIEENS